MVRRNRENHGDGEDSDADGIEGSGHDEDGAETHGQGEDTDSD